MITRGKNFVFSALIATVANVDRHTSHTHAHAHTHNGSWDSYNRVYLVM